MTDTAGFDFPLSSIYAIQFIAFTIRLPAPS